MKAQNPKEWLRLLRERLNLTAEQLAEQLGTSRQTIYRWESQGGQPTLAQAAKLAAMARTSVDEVAGIFGCQLAA